MKLKYFSTGLLSLFVWSALGACSGIVAHASGCKAYLESDSFDPNIKQHFFLDHKEPISYGLEVEYLVESAPMLLSDYRTQNISEERWHQLSPEEKLRQVKSHSANSKFASLVATIFGRYKLEKMPQAPSWLPQNLRIEPHGRLELSDFIFENPDQLFDVIDELKLRYGKGYLQPHVVYPKTYSPKGLGGYALFSSDRYQLKTLESGYERFLQEPNFIPGRNLTHHGLGPISEATKVTMLKRATSVTPTNKLGDGGLTRLIYGPVLRDDIYPHDRVGFELRHPNTNIEWAKSEVLELTQHLERNDFKMFKDYESVEFLSSKLFSASAAFDGQVNPVAWQDYFESLQKYLLKKSRFYWTGGANYSQRFLIPLRDWANNPVVLMSAHPAEIKLRINKATKGFVAEVENIMQSKLDNAVAVRDLQIAVARWAYETNLSALFDLYARTSNISLND